MAHLATVITILTIGGAYADLSPTAIQGRIVGGENVEIQDYPYQVSLEKNGRHDCGGIIVSAKRVLTAAHCVPKLGQPAVYTVRAGSSFREQGGSVHRVEKVTYHSASTVAKAVLNADIAVLHLIEPIKFDKLRRPIALFNANEKLKDNQQTVVTGWGRTNSAGGEFSKQLQSVVLPIVNFDICNKAYKGRVTAGQICAGYYGKGGKDACQGDSGGPMVVNGKLAGITSWGMGCAQPQYPGVYTEIAHYRNWIKQYAGV